MRILELYSHGVFQVYQTVLLSVVTHCDWIPTTNLITEFVPFDQHLASLPFLDPPSTMHRFSVSMSSKVLDPYTSVIMQCLSVFF